MHDEMRVTGYRGKSISAERDRAQSRVLVGIVGTLLLGFSACTLRAVLTIGIPRPVFATSALGISVAFALAVSVLKAATPAGAAFGGMICWLMTYWTATAEGSIIRTALAPLVVLFVLTFLSTRAGRTRKVRAGLAEGPRGRSAAQVIANLAVGALSVAVVGARMRSDAFQNSRWREAMLVMCLAALIEATADTASSEIGQAFGGVPVMLLTLKRTDPGTDGAVSLLGTIAGIAAGAIVAAAGMWGLRLGGSLGTVALGAGIAGLFVDSILGSTVERRGWLGNDLVNFSSTAFAAGMALVFWFFLSSSAKSWS